MSDDAALQRLLDTAAAVVPGWSGRSAPPGATPWHACSRHELAALRARWAERHPEAGAPYWALRGWGLLVWQPVYLAVIGVHLGEGCPVLDHLSQPVASGDVDAFTLGGHALLDGDEAGRMRHAAAQLAEGFEVLLGSWRALTALHAKAARRTCADCTLAALLAVHRHHPGWCADEVSERGERWLRALGLAGESGFFRYRLVSGGEALALDRQVCCLHFRRRDGERCATCPRRPLADRIGQLAG